MSICGGVSHCHIGRLCTVATLASLWQLCGNVGNFVASLWHLWQLCGKFGNFVASLASLATLWQLCGNFLAIFSHLCGQNFAWQLACHSGLPPRLIAHVCDNVAHMQHCEPQSVHRYEALLDSVVSVVQLEQWA